MGRVTITPSIMGKNQPEVTRVFRKLKGTSSKFHLDVADRKCVPSTSLWFNFRIPTAYKYAAHLMIRKPLEWMKLYERKIDLFIVQFEEVEDWDEYFAWTKLHHKKRAVAIRPKTNVKKVLPYVSQFDQVLVLTVQPGFYGAPFVPQALKTINMVKKVNPKLKVIVDGHMNPKTAPMAVRAGADVLVCGSYLAGAADPKKALRELRKAIREKS